MIGGIYAYDKCPVCGGKFFHDAKNGLICQQHPEQKSQEMRVVFKGVRKRFKRYKDAANFLSGLRFKTVERTFDPRDYASDNPLGFSNYVTKYLITKKGMKSFRDIKRNLGKAVAVWENRNIKAIGYAEIEDFLLTLDYLAGKTQHNILSDLHSFFTWACRREKKLEMPEFPHVQYKLGWRTIVTPEDQLAILGKVYDLTYHENPKVWLGIKWLMTYISIRPGELINIKEGDFDLNMGIVVIKDPKEVGKSKTIPLMPNDVDLIKEFPRGLPHVYFFRHNRTKSGVREGTKFGDKYLYKAWKKACSELGIEDVDLYGGTRHSTARALRHTCSPEQIRLATMHTTNKAFERYFQFEANDVRAIYAKTSGQVPGKKNAHSKVDKVLKLKG